MFVYSFGYVFKFVLVFCNSISYVGPTCISCFIFCSSVYWFVLFCDSFSSVVILSILCFLYGLLKLVSLIGGLFYLGCIFYSLFFIFIESFVKYLHSHKKRYHHSHLLSLVVIRCHWLYHSLSLVVSLVCLFISNRLLSRIFLSRDTR